LSRYLADLIVYGCIWFCVSGQNVIALKGFPLQGSKGGMNGLLFFYADTKKLTLKNRPQASG
jgi:hypothetical protein